MNIKNIVNGIVDKYSLNMLVLFGSQVKGNVWQGSDADFAFWSAKRLIAGSLENLIVDLIRLSESEKINAIDLYFDGDQEIEQLNKTNSKYGTELSLLQYEIYNTGKLLFERTPGLFNEKRAAALSNARFQGKNIKETVAQDKLKNLKRLAEAINDLDFQNREKSVSLPANALQDQKLKGYLDEAETKIVLDFFASAVKLNKFILNEFYKISIVSGTDSFLKLIDTGKISDKEEIDKIRSLAKLTNFKSLLTIDYFYGSAWTVAEIKQQTGKLTESYFKIIEKIIT